MLAAGFRLKQFAGRGDSHLSTEAVAKYIAVVSRNLAQRS